MSYLGTEKLKELINTQKVIGPEPDLNRVKNGAYELTLGNEVFRTDSKDKKKEILKADKEQVTINPGQFALLLTQETVNIPLHKIAFISIKAGIKLKGLVNVSGFHVDPGFKGNLVFSVYNAGTSPISLIKGEPYFLIWFAELELTDKENDRYDGEHKNQDSIPSRYIDALIAGELASPNALLEKIDSNHRTLEQKIGIVEEKKKFNEYLIKAILGLLIVIGVRVIWEAGQYYLGYKKGYDKKTEEVSTDSLNRKLLKEIYVLSHKVDSMIKKPKTSLNFSDDTSQTNSQ